MNRSVLKIIFVLTFVAVGSLCLMSFSFAQEDIDPDVVSEEKAVPEKVDYPEIPAEDLIRQIRQASFKKDLEEVDSLSDQCISLFEERAKEQQAELSNFPERGSEDQYQQLNNLATCLFVQAETSMNTGQTKKAILQFQKIIDDYKWSQAWDPRGWYWSVAEKSQASIDVLTGKVEVVDESGKGKKTFPNIENQGTEKIIDYAKYGDFKNVGTASYHYEVTNPKGLSAAVGVGVFPSPGAVFKDPRYRQLREEGRLKGKHWDFVNTPDLEAAYYKWFSAPEPWGIKLFYLGLIYEKSHMYHHAIKAYHSIVVHFPKTVGWTYWQTPWYPAQAAIAKIKYIIRTHPELNLEAKWMKIEITNGFDNDVENDIIVTYPGVVVEKGLWDIARDKMMMFQSTKLGKAKQKIGKGKVRLVEYENGHWRLMVKGKPFTIKGITYAPTKIGQSPDKNTLVSWMEEDSDNNGRLDGPYDAWVDKNGNNVQDEDEKAVGDFQLMKEMGVNTIREYHQPFKPQKEVLRKMHKKYGFMVIMGDFLGKYTLGSGASWFEGTDYENEEHRKNMMESVKSMVMEFKDEPYILMWLLGNENNYGVASNADKKPEAYFAFVNDVARMIKSIDKKHPVAVCNGDTLYLDIFAKYAPAVDIFSANIYRGDYGFSSFWEQVLDATGRPAFVTEFGSPAYAKHLTLEEAEQAQADYHRGNWLDIEANIAGTHEGAGNALGGVVFEWTDEWWKNYEPYRHDRKSDAVGPFPGGYYFEEWFGITSQGDGKSSPFLRHLRKSYYLYKEMWNK